MLQFLFNFVREKTVTRKMEINGKDHQKIQNFEDLDLSIQELIESAVQARKLAYCPYSNFAVGAALRTTSGEIIKGCNVENGAHTPSICAERTAIVKAVSEGHTNFEAIAVVAFQEDQFTSPCGVCRQVISEFASKDIKVYISKPVPVRILCTSLYELLPYRFDSSRLKQDS
ncbi:unnamed protein product [Chironomus riparius]|uniref:Cytidine deaminase n=1 Tax=Chironomus riparius TaxID=315576 RepID=A0A9N9RST5_9DIPT|nr:unnamed protein product [Chironomus riparius]